MSMVHGAVVVTAWSGACESSRRAQACVCSAAPRPPPGSWAGVDLRRAHGRAQLAGPCLLEMGPWMGCTLK